MKEKVKVPELRFDGFTDDWEQRKLGELSQKISVGIATSSSKHFSSQDQGVPFIKNQDIKENRINTKNLEYISKEFDNKNKNKRVRQGDIITARTGYPGLSAVVPKELEGAQTFTTLITRPISEMILSEYISIFINSPYGMKQISGMEAGGAQKNVNAGILQNLLIPLPSLDEQKQISNFVLKLDNTITLHQRKLDLLKEQKKGYLQKMFPKNGSKIPELRFAGFADDWEERKLKELGDIQTGNTPPTSNLDNYSTDGVLWVTPTDIKTLVISDTAKKLSEVGVTKARIAKAGSILVTSIASIGKNTLVTMDAGFNQQINSLTPTPKNDSYFLLTQSEKWSEKMKKTAASATMQIVNKTDFSNISTFVPVHKEEQQKIGSFFKQLDDTIALHQRKLDLLKEQKKGYLQKMFA
ncbi:restriction endonuclease subunit S [Lactococcus lactis subsp. lactis]|uniref:restriction endonuclease subunit S n=1 Tax=Lactococcus lactis TaxID=1358 RepID=UPI00264A3654|nr:restriction endonuclease subunit S [Lactococcus lactis]WKB48370.1 restriction endonuclease subunit S [Lactococcus lactis subsp. lactis]